MLVLATNVSSGCGEGKKKIFVKGVGSGVAVASTVTTFTKPSCLGRRKKERGDDIVHDLSVTLEDLYNGATKQINLNRSVLCVSCAPTETLKSATCKYCHGSGYLTYSQKGSNAGRQARSVCKKCSGSGNYRNNGCKICKGKGIINERKVLNVHIEKGAKHGQKVLFSQESDQEVSSNHTTKQIDILHLQIFFLFPSFQCP